MRNSSYNTAEQLSRTPPNGEASPNGTISRWRLVEQYLAAGYAITPVKPSSKQAFLDAWSTYDVPVEELQSLYADKPYNIGGRLGEPSENLVDTDIDCAEALAIADGFMTRTDAVFGRASTPEAHRLYRAALTTEKFTDPTKTEDDPGAMLVEIRSTGVQTVLPGSTHESGERVEWVGGERLNPPEAAAVEPSELRREVALLATTALLGRYYPAKGARHEFELGLAGALLRIELDPTEAIKILDGIAIVAGVGSDSTAAGKVRDTKRKLDAGEAVTGWPAVIDALGGDDAARKIANRVVEWLTIKTPETRQTRSNFYAYLPSHKYIFRPIGTLWEPAGVNSNLKAIADGFDADGDPIMWKPSTWLDAHRPVHQITWMPGHPEYIKDVLIDEGGVTSKMGMRAYNQYQPPRPTAGDPTKAGPWLDLIEAVYPAGKEHMLGWFACRVQRPGEKINHALVLGGAPGIGKDTILEGIIHAVGPHNCREVSPSNIVERFHEFLQSIILRVSEAKDLGEANRYAFYERMKTIIAAPPATIRVDQKYIGAYQILNLTGVIFTTNNRTNGLYLPAEDRRHYVAWSDARPDHLTDEQWLEMYDWYANQGGFGHVRAYLEEYDLGGFNPKAPPSKTEAFWAMVNANRDPESGALSDALDTLGEALEDGTVERPRAFIIDQLIKAVAPHAQYNYSNGGDAEVVDLYELLAVSKNKRRLPHALEKAGYMQIANPDAPSDARWRIASLGKKKRDIYALISLSSRDRIVAARALANREAE